MMRQVSGATALPGTLSLALLTARLRKGKHAAATIVQAVSTRIGAEDGFTGGGLHRIALTWDAPGAGPASVVAKLSPDDPRMRALMRQANAAEAAFYHASGVSPHLPRCHHARGDPLTGESVILLDDLTSHRRVGLTDGASPKDAAAVVEALAALHARWWGRAPALPDPGPALSLAACWPRYRAAVAAVLPDVGLPDWFLAWGRRLAGPSQPGGGPHTLLHRDPHVGNALFAPDGTAVLLDWQFVGTGPGAWDLGYFLISSLDPAQRRATERGLVTAYHATLVRAGVADYPADACWRDYLGSVAGKLWLTVVATVAFDNTGAARAAYRRADLERLLAFCQDHGVSGDAAAGRAS